MRLLQDIEMLNRVVGSCAEPRTLGIRVLGPSVGKVALDVTLWLQFFEFRDHLLVVTGISQPPVVSKAHSVGAGGFMSAYMLSAVDHWSVYFDTMKLTTVIFETEDKITCCIVWCVCKPVALGLINPEMVFFTNVDVALFDRILLLRLKRRIKDDIRQTIEWDCANDSAGVVCRTISTADDNTRSAGLSQRCDCFV